jgi:hypothetical protein
MTQWIGIAAVVGLAARQIVVKFSGWNSQRVADVDDPSLFEPSQWPVACRREMAVFAGALRENATAPPIVFYREYVDSWSFSQDLFGSFCCEDGREMIEVLYESSELACYPLPDAGALVRGLKAAKRRKFYREDMERRWFIDGLLDACEACDWLASDGAIVISRCVVDGSRLDEEIRAAAERVPDWLARLNGID